MFRYATVTAYALVTPPMLIVFYFVTSTLLESHKMKNLILLVDCSCIPPRVAPLCADWQTLATM